MIDIFRNNSQGLQVLNSFDTHRLHLQRN